MSPRYRVTLTQEERKELKSMTLAERPTPDDLSVLVLCNCVMLVWMVRHGMFPMLQQRWG